MGQRNKTLSYYETPEFWLNQFLKPVGFKNFVASFIIADPGGYAPAGTAGSNSAGRIVICLL